MGELPKDPMILMSFVNMKLRDEYASLDELSKALGVERQEIENALKAIGMEYSKENNKFW